MSQHCHHDHNLSHASNPSAADPRYRRILWVALLVNALMFAVEIGSGLKSGSLSLLADAIDFFGDAANYGVSLFVLSMGLVGRARAAQLKGGSMLAFGVFVLVQALMAVNSGQAPAAWTMSTVGLLALVANLGVAALLYAWRTGDANMRSVWLCSRNDAIGNLAVIAAGFGVLGTGSAWPDLAVAAGMAGLAIHGGVSVLRQARRELQGLQKLNKAAA
jgi:Co/Zn/Cd efflux system component